MSRSGSKTVDRIETTAYALIALTLILLVAKVVGYVTWSWWIVTMPIWIVPALGIVALIAAAVMVTFEKGWKA